MLVKKTKDNIMGENINQSKEIQILEAAEHEFLAKGYDGARTTSIAKIAGVTHAMLHYYFRTKEQLFEQIIDKKMSEITPMLTYLFGNEKLPLTERIKEAVSVHFDFIIDNPDLPRFLINEVLPNKERFKVLKSKIDNVLHSVEHLQKEVDEAALRGEVAQFNIINLFQTILSLNIFSSIIPRFMENMFEENNFNTKEFLAIRKAENIETIMRRIKKL